MVMLVPISIEGNVMLKDLGTLYRQEEEVELHVRESIMQLTSEIKGDSADSNDDEDDSESPFSDAELSYIVPSTGARVDVRSSCQVLTQYCQVITRASFIISPI
jgi:hypothetical protein